MENFRKLKVWQKAHLLVLKIYRITNSFPVEEQFGLVSQLRRAAVSIAANIAEGSKRPTAKDQRHFYVMSEGSLEETKYYIILGYDLRYIELQPGRELMEQAREIGKMLSKLAQSIA